MTSNTENIPMPKSNRALFLEQMKRTFRSNKLTGVGAAIFLLVVLAAIFAPLLSTHDHIDQNILYRLEGPSDQFLMGTDAYGRDIYSRLLHGARISLIIGGVAIISAMIIGTAIGIIAGYYGGRTDDVIMQFNDILLSFPTLILGLIVVAMLGPSMQNMIIAISLTSIPGFTRIARAPTIVIRERDFIEACRALGYRDWRIMVYHILPNVLSDVMVMASLWLATAIRTEASLSFIGLGVKPPEATWGGMIREGFENILDNPWLSIFPGLAILLVVFSLNLLGDGLRDAIDPKTRED
jgi:peptide/nickel transport system permease protein